MISNCAECQKVKGKRRCMTSGQLICSKCCGEKRSWTFCNTECEYFPNESVNYVPYNSQKTELVMLPSGITTKFEVPLFLPNLFDVITCTVKELKIDLLDFNKAIVSIQFKLAGDRELGNEVYIKDRWKIPTSNVIIRNDKILAPLIIMSTAVGSTCNFVESKSKYGESSLSLVKTSYSLNVWLPYSKSSMKKIDVRDKPEFNSNFVTGVVNEGRLASKKNDVFWAELNTKFDYKISFQIDNTDIVVKEEKKSLLYLGFFLPYKKVIVEKFILNKSSSFSISEDSFLALQTFGEQKIDRLWEIPLEENFKNQFHGGYVKNNILDLSSPYHYDEYLYNDYFFFLRNKSDISINVLFNSDDIVSAYFNILREVYKGKYSPILLILANMSMEIKKIKVIFEIKSLSERCVETIYLSPLETLSLPLFPILNETKLSELNEHTAVQFFVEVFYDNELIYEESKNLNCLPKETFVYDSEDLGKAYKYYFYSFLARWVTPNSVSIESLINEAVEAVGGLEGMSQEPDNIMKEIKALYDVISSKVKYVSKTFSLYKGLTSLHQKVHLPDNTVANGGGNCIDLVVLMASCLEKLGYNPQIIIVPEHSYLGVKFDNFSVFLEMTYISESNFHESLVEGNRVHQKYFDNTNNAKMEKCIIIDVKQSRKAKIYPMN
ncbi:MULTISPECIES: hypothetical protein [Sphingobacterium]|uniref:hypothetical protein n=1 Tax=Sphingobacterium TaxID=28453 RepID=UPI0010F32039|nr:MULTISPECIES: hypothetical protein [Sphingobacterium]MCW2259616.1 hypothetical protein [Sphingobacterium kitahiroshimense]TCR13941.1 hypothetical protein EDF67_10144 [Sphingobacterium sp. JUb78]